MDPIENTLTPEASLGLITQTILKTRTELMSKSTCFLLWGWLIFSASMLCFGLQQFTGFKYYFLPYPVLASVGIVLTFFVNRPALGEFATQTYETHFFRNLWKTLAAGFIAVVLVSVTQGQLPFCFILIIAGIGTLLTGLVLDFKPLILGGICFFIASLICVFLADPYKPLMTGLAVLVGYLIPGYLLRNISRAS